MWQRHLQDAWHHGKRTIAGMWGSAVKFAGQLDHAANVSKRLFGALHPMIEDLGGSHVNRAIMGGIQNYERGRDEVMGGHNKVQAQLSRIRKAVPEIDLD